MLGETALALGGAIVLGIVHLEGHRLRFLDVLPRSRWLSGAGGVSVAYVFVHLLPELAAISEELVDQIGWVEEALVYVVAMSGLAIFYGVERAVKVADDADARLWVHVTAFTLYNLIVGYALLHRGERDLVSTSLFILAMIPHFLVNDYGLRQENPRLFRHEARWILAFAPLAGCLIGVYFEPPRMGISLLLAFLSGGVILNVLKEELPEERKSHYWAFLTGAGVYTAVLLMAG